MTDILARVQAEIDKFDAAKILKTAIAAAKTDKAIVGDPAVDIAQNIFNETDITKQEILDKLKTLVPEIRKALATTINEADSITTLVTLATYKDAASVSDDKAA
jgi:hypothetical protein